MQSLNTIEQYIRQQIHQGCYRPDERIESERRIALALGVKHCQVHAALQRLAEDGTLECRRNSGYYVSRPKTPAATTLALLVTSQGGGLWSQALHTLLRQAQNAGLQLHPITRSGEANELGAVLDDILQTPAYAGAVVLPSHREEWAPAFSRALATQYPLLFLERALFPGIFSSVETNHFDTGFRAARLLAQAGACRPLFLGYSSGENQVAALRWEGFLQGTRFFGTKDPCSVFSGSATIGLADQLQQQFDAKAFDGIFAASAMFTQIALGWSLRANLQPGRDYLLLGMDGPAPLPGLGYAVDCLCQDMEREALLAVDLLREMIRDRGTALARNILTPPLYVEGRTLGK